MMAAGMEHLRAGRLKEAEGVYQQVLADDPKNAESTQIVTSAFERSRERAGSRSPRQHLAAGSSPDFLPIRFVSMS